MKRFVALLLLLVLGSAAGAEAAEYTGRVREDTPMLTVTVSASGVFLEDSHRPCELVAHVAAQDGSLTQDVAWFSNESPVYDGAAALVMLRDFNFDGFADLHLLTAAGARNIFHNIALWNPLHGRFDPVLTLDGDVLEVCNALYSPERLEVLSVIEDGYRWRLETAIGWDTPRTPARRAEAEVYDAGDGIIGERLTVYAPEPRLLWDQTYSEEWYHHDGDFGAGSDRMKALRLFVAGDGLTSPRIMQVANVDWVNLRHLDSKSSDSLARLERGTQVQVLQAGRGEDGGWVLVWISREQAGLPSGAAAEGLTGYIWHSYLQ